MIKNIVFDMGNVLLEFDLDTILERNGITDPAEKEIMFKKLFLSREWRQYDEGTCEKDAFRPVLDSLPPRLKEIGYKMIINQCFALNEMPPVKFMYGFIKELKDNGYKIYLLSNAGQDFYIYSKANPALELFDRCFVSSDYKLLKPNREIYEKFFEVMDVKPEECVFIDDVQENVDGSIACGMDAVCFNSTKDDLDYLKGELRSRGVRI